MEQAGLDDALHAGGFGSGDDVVVLFDTLADLAGRDQQERVDAGKRRGKRLGLGILESPSRHTETGGFVGRADDGHDMVAANLSFKRSITRRSS